MGLVTEPTCTVCKNLDPKNDLFFGNSPNNRELSIHPRIALLKFSGRRGCGFCAFLYDSIVAALPDMADDRQKEVHVLFSQDSPIWLHVWAKHGHITFQLYSPPGKHSVFTPLTLGIVR